jgi:hypothetical protein
MKGSLLFVAWSSPAVATLCSNASLGATMIAVGIIRFTSQLPHLLTCNPSSQTIVNQRQLNAVLKALLRI